MSIATLSLLLLLLLYIIINIYHYLLRGNVNENSKMKPTMNKVKYVKVIFHLKSIERRKVNLRFS